MVNIFQIIEGYFDTGFPKQQQQQKILTKIDINLGTHRSRYKHGVAQWGGTVKRLFKRYILVAVFFLSFSLYCMLLLSVYKTMCNNKEWPV